MTHSHKSFSIRLPLSTASKLAAYLRLNPQKNRTDSIVYLLEVALAGYELHLPADHRQIFLHAAQDLLIQMALPSSKGTSE